VREPEAWMVGPKRDAVRNLYQRVTTTRSLPTKVKYPYQGTTPTNRYSTRSERVWPPPLDGVGVRAALGQLSFLYASSRSTDSVLIPSGSGYLVSPCPGPASLPISPLIHCLLASPSFTPPFPFPNRPAIAFHGNVANLLLADHRTHFRV
jgi:hypothetical protein